MAAEITSGSLNRTAISARMDELCARTGVRAQADLGAWSEEVDRALAAVSAAAATADGRWSPGTWAGGT